MEEMTTISFYAPVSLRDGIDRWAEGDERSRSNLLCLILQPLVDAQNPRDINDEPEEDAR